MTATAATDSYLLLRAFCDELARCGLRDACTSPGSRNTPIVLSLAREPRIRCWSHIDERCAGFFALGAAKAAGRPVALTCTSGTAAANLAPAVIEAFHARVPLIVLTADRPPELREVGAGQTIDQVKLYGDAVKWFFEVGVHDATPERLRWIRSLACRAYWTAVGGRSGPVHLNLPLREPLVLDGPLPDDPVPGRPGGAPWRRRVRGSAPTAAVPSPLPPRGVVVAGAGADGAELARVAERAGYPLLADPLSGARHGATAIGRYDLLLREPAFTAGVVPDLIVRAGDLPTSKPLRAWLASLGETPQLAIDGRAAEHDPDAGVTDVVADDAPSWDPAPPDAPDPAWLARWRRADVLAGETISDVLGEQLSEPLLAASLGRWLTPEATLYVASSMPIRDVELLHPAGVPGPRVLSNRGANGIDGTVSSAFGAAAAQDGPVVLLIGDVALLHDVGGLLAAGRLGLALTIVLINNDGGGIFHFLPVAAETDAFEAHVATPHGIEFGRAAALYGLGYERPQDLAQLQSAVRQAQLRPETILIEVRTDREDNLLLHRRMAAAVTGVLGPPAPAVSGALSRPAPAASHRA